MKQESKIAIAIVGCGDIGWPNAQAVASAQSACVACTYDTNISVAQELARKLGTRVAPSYEAVLNDKNVDAVLLSVPHHMHVPLAVQAAVAGKHVLLEKPLANTLEEADRIVSSCRASNVKLTVNYSFRLSSCVQFAATLVKEGALGDVAGVSVHHMIQKGRAYWWGGFFGRTPDNWRAIRLKAGGGILIMGLVHSLDYLQYVVASRIDRVYCEYATRATEADVEDTLSLSCRFANGAIGNWCASTCHAGDAVTSERIWGSRGSMSLKPTPGHFFLMRRHANWAPGRAHNMNIRDEVNFRAAWVDDMAAAVLQDREPIIGWQDARHMTALVDAAYRSQIAGQAVELPNLDSATAFARPMGAPVRMVA